MWKRFFWMGMVLVTCLSVSAQEQQDRLRVMFDLTVASRYVAHGINIGDDEAVVQPSVFLQNVFTPGLEFFVWTNFAIDREQHAADEYDFVVRYTRLLAPRSPFGVRAFALADYYVYPHYELPVNKNGKLIEKTDFNGFKLGSGIEFVNLIPPLGPVKLIPGYSLYYWTPIEKKLFEDGYANEFSLTCVVPLPIQERQLLFIRAVRNYYSEIFGIERGLSHTSLHMATTFNFGHFQVRPTVNYQWTHEPTMNHEDEFWFSIALVRTF